MTTLNKKDRELIIKIAKKQADQGKEITAIKKQIAGILAKKFKLSAEDGMNKLKVKFKDGRISTPQMDQMITRAMAEAITGLCKQVGVSEIDISYREANKGRQT
jgi:hypothetical protein